MVLLANFFLYCFMSLMNRNVTDFNVIFSSGKYKLDDSISVKPVSRLGM